MDLAERERIMRARRTAMEKTWEPPSVSYLLMAAACGFFGVVSGYAIFLNYQEIVEHPWLYVLALLVAALVSYFIEFMRELVRHGKAGWKEMIGIRAAGTFVVLLLIEVFIGAFHSATEVASGSAIMDLGRSLVAVNAPAGNGALRVELLIALSWALVGAALATALALCVSILHARGEEDRQVAKYGTVGAVSGFLAAPIFLLVYFLIARLVVTFYYAIGNAQQQTAEGHYACPYSVSQTFSGYHLYCIVPALLRAAQFVGPVTFGVVFVFLPALVVAVALAWVSFFSEGRGSARGGIVLAMVSVALAIFVAWPLVQAVWQVLGEFIHLQATGWFAALIFSALVWLTPGFLLGCLTPFLRTAARDTRRWSIVGYGAAGLLVAATVLRLALGSDRTGRVWVPLLAAVIAAGIGRLFVSGLSPREHWPLAALCVALGIVGMSSISQELTLGSVMNLIVKAELGVARGNEG